MTKKQKLVVSLLVILAFGLGMATMVGCGCLTKEQIAGTASTVLEIAYASGGATTVSQRIDQMVADGKITTEQAAQLKAAAQRSYEELQKKLKELSVENVEVTVTK